MKKLKKHTYKGPGLHFAKSPARLLAVGRTMQTLRVRSWLKKGGK